MNTCGVCDAGPLTTQWGGRAPQRSASLSHCRRTEALPRTEARCPGTATRTGVDSPKREPGTVGKGLLAAVLSEGPPRAKGEGSLAKNGGTLPRHCDQSRGRPPEAGARHRGEESVVL